MTSFTGKDHSWSKTQKIINNQLLEKRIAELDRLKNPINKNKNRFNEDNLDEV